MDIDKNTLIFSSPKEHDLFVCFGLLDEYLNPEIGVATSNHKT